MIMKKVSENKITKKGKGAVDFNHSIKAKIMILVGLSVYLSAAVILLVFVPYTGKILKNETHNYMLDLTVSNGTIL